MDFTQNDAEIIKIDFECSTCKKLDTQNSRIPVQRVIEKLDNCFKTNDLQSGVRLLEYWQDEAKALGDLSGELSIVNEMLGIYRRTNDGDKALSAVKRALELLKLTENESKASGATIMLNAATTLKAFGKADEALSLYDKVGKVYSRELDKSDLRRAALFNNHGTALVDLSRFDEAEKLYRQAIEITLSQPDGLLDAAVTYVNLAHLYEKSEGEMSEKIEDCLNQAEQILDNEKISKDAYYAFVSEKCAPSFDYFGYFLTAQKLYKLSRKIYEGT